MVVITDAITSEDVSGEQVRRNLTENEQGIPLTLDIQVVDSKTCQPLKDVAVDIWGCNTTVRLRPSSFLNGGTFPLLTAQHRVYIAAYGPTTSSRPATNTMTDPLSTLRLSEESNSPMETALLLSTPYSQVIMTVAPSTFMAS